MDLTELEKQRPYADLLTWLRDPLGSRAIGDRFALTADARALISTLDHLRSSQDVLVTKLAVSPVIESRPRDTKEASVLAKDRPAYLLRPPRMVARRFVTELIRAGRVSGLASERVRRQLSNQPTRDPFLLMLEWLSDMESAPRARRHPLAQWFEQMNDNLGNVKWVPAFGPVLGRFVARHLETSRGWQDWQRDMMGQWIHKLFAAEVVYGADEWSRDFINCGGKRLDELSGLDE